MKYLQCLLILISFFNAEILLGQNENSKMYAEFNLPPGAVLNQKPVIIDLSYKLDHKSSAVSYQDSDLKVLKDFSAQDLEFLKTTSPAYYKYYNEGLSFINGLSPKIKSTYTSNELWYIFAFDQKLKNRISTIK